jgi:hypothetical protein
MSSLRLEERDASVSVLLYQQLREFWYFCTSQPGMGAFEFATDLLHFLFKRVVKSAKALDFGRVFVSLQLRFFLLLGTLLQLRLLLCERLGGCHSSRVSICTFVPVKQAN